MSDEPAAAAAAPPDFADGSPGCGAPDAGGDLLASRCCVVLVEPRDARNVGMVARACANFGVTRLAVVHAAKLRAALDRAGRSAAKAAQLGLSASSDSKECALDLSAWKGCERLATGEGTEVLQGARLFGDLAEALKASDRAVAFSGRVGANFRQATLTLPQLARGLFAAESQGLAAEPQGPAASSLKRPRAETGRGTTALVFGSEDVGLSTESVLMCDDVCRLRTSTCPSLNLSHAVAVVLARVHEEACAASDGSGEANRSEGPPAEQRQELPQLPPMPRTVPACSEVASSEQAPAAWTADWSELCRQLLEERGYPAQAELWHGRGRRRCKFAYRLFKVVADCARTLQRARVPASETASWRRLVELLARGRGEGGDASGSEAEAEA